MVEQFTPQKESSAEGASASSSQTAVMHTLEALGLLRDRKPVTDGLSVKPDSTSDVVRRVLNMGEPRVYEDREEKSGYASLCRAIQADGAHKDWVNGLAANVKAHGHMGFTAANLHSEIVGGAGLRAKIVLLAAAAAIQEMSIDAVDGHLLNRSRSRQTPARRFDGLVAKGVSVPWLCRLTEKVLKEGQLSMATLRTLGAVPPNPNELVRKAKDAAASNQWGAEATKALSRVAPYCTVDPDAGPTLTTQDRAEEAAPSTPARAAAPPAPASPQNPIAALHTMVNADGRTLHDIRDPANAYCAASC